MYADILKLRAWYRTPTGHVARRAVQGRLNTFWPTLTGRRLLVVGYGVPYLGLIDREAQVFCAMPGKMGVLPWPEGEKNRAFLTWTDGLPLPDKSVDNILLLHALEFAERPEDTLNECSRVLKDDGRLLIVTPNRTGAWARRENSPFGRGHPYSARQLSRLLGDACFMTAETAYGLFVPPTSRRWLLATWQSWENLGSRWWPWLGGVVMVEAVKDISSTNVIRVKGKAPRFGMMLPRAPISPCKGRISLF